MKLFFASDLHGSLPATEKVLELYQASRPIFNPTGWHSNHGPRNWFQRVTTRLLLQTSWTSSPKRSLPSVSRQRSRSMLLFSQQMMDYSWVLLESGQRIFLTHGHPTQRNDQHWKRVISLLAVIPISQLLSTKMTSSFLTLARWRSLFRQGRHAKLQYLREWYLQSDQPWYYDVLLAASFKS